MPVEDVDGAIVITGVEDIAQARRIALAGMLSLEIKGMRRRGRSAYAIIKQEFGLHGTKRRVLDQFKKQFHIGGE